jgi:hypothetical protein
MPSLGVERLVWTAIVDLLNIAGTDCAILEQGLAVKLLREAGGGWADGAGWVTPGRMAKLARCERCGEPFEGPAGPCGEFWVHIAGSARWCKGCGEWFEPSSDPYAADECGYYADGKHRQDPKQALVDEAR